MPPAIIAAVIGAGASLGGALINKSGANHTQTSTTTAQYTPDQLAMMERIRSILAHRLKKGPQVLQADRNAGRTSVNNTYNAIAPNVESNLTARGYGDSGKLGSALLGVNVARANSFQKLESDLTDQANQRYEQTIQDAVNFTRPSGSQTVTQLPSQSYLGPAVAGLGGDAATLIYLSQLLKGSGGSSPAGGGSYPDFSQDPSL